VLAGRGFAAGQEGGGAGAEGDRREKRGGGQAYLLAERLTCNELP
jgi:hypothetical protein